MGVIAPFRDVETDERVTPPGTMTVSEARAKRMEAAKVGRRVETTERGKPEHAATRVGRPTPKRKAPAKPERPKDRTALPSGYTAAHVAGGYYRLRGPDGPIPGPSNGKWQGKDGVADAAWDDLRHRTEAG